jgi:hypothetical protein
MSFFYDRTATINRSSQTFPTTGPAVQVVASVYTGVACSIQMKRPMTTGLATDNTPMAGWEVLLDPAFAGVVVADDQLIDDLTRTFRVKSAYPTPLGWQLLAEDSDATK